jgi:hypothetical protein
MAAAAAAAASWQPAAFLMPVLLQFQNRQQ